MASYGNESPYANTTIVNGQYLGFLKPKFLKCYFQNINLLI